MIDIYTHMTDIFEDHRENMIPLPRMSEFLLEEFMIPMELTATEVSEGTGIPLYDVEAILRDEQEITPEQSEKLGSYFGVSDMLFYDIQEDLKERAGVRELAFA